MEQITKYNIEEVKEKYLKHGKNILYGAANTGCEMYQIMTEAGVEIYAFVDDDIAKQGKELLGKKILSRGDVEEMAASEQINIIISSIYGKIIEQNLKNVPVHLFSAYGWLVDKFQDILRAIIRKQPKDTWLAKIHRIRELVKDKESEEILNAIEKAGLRERTDGKIDAKDEELFQSVQTTEEHYFVEPISSILTEKSVIVDCGAFTGDMLGQLQRLGIPYGEVYAFEANPRLYIELQDNARKLGVAERVHAFNCGVWNESGEMSFSFSDISPSGGHLSTGGGHDYCIRVKTERLDKLIQGKIDLLKMDIEGAELPALYGAERVLNESRPVLAISIYHSFDDVVDIPLYLMQKMDKYKFFLRHHSYTWGETVLYGIPQERLK